MRKVLCTTLAVAAILAICSDAMAQSRRYRSNWMAAAPGPSAPFNFANPLDAYDVGDTPNPFGGARPWGSALNSASQPYYNPALDRAKGNID